MVPGTSNSADPTKVVAIFGTRPEAIKLFPVVRAMQAHTRIDVRTCVTAQHREMLDQVLDFAGIVPDHDLDLMRAGQSLDELTGRLLQSIGKVLDTERPDHVVVQGDTTSALVGALAAYYHQIPVAHVEAGLRSHDLFHPWPEEGNRKMIGAIADWHFAPTETAARALSLENVPKERVIVTGNTVIDALMTVAARDDSDLVSDPALRSAFDRAGDRRIVGVTTHRRENLGDGLRAIADALHELAGSEDIAIIFPVHLNPAVRDTMNARLSDCANVTLLEPLDYLNFVALLKRCHCLLTDSGGVQEEAPALGKPVLVMRETTERPEGVEAGTARLVGTDTARIVEETRRLLHDADHYDAMARAHNPFGDGHASDRIADVLSKPLTR